MTLLNSVNENNSTSICNENNNTYRFDFGNQITLSGLSIISNGNTQTSESFSLKCTGQNKSIENREVVILTLVIKMCMFYKIREY